MGGAAELRAEQRQIRCGPEPGAAQAALCAPREVLLTQKLEQLGVAGAICGRRAGNSMGLFRGLFLALFLGEI